MIYLLGLWTMIYFFVKLYKMFVFFWIMLEKSRQTVRQGENGSAVTIAESWWRRRDPATIAESWVSICFFLNKSLRVCFPPYFALHLASNLASCSSILHLVSPNFLKVWNRGSKSNLASSSSSRVRPNVKTSMRLFQVCTKSLTIQIDWKC